MNRRIATLTSRAPHERRAMLLISVLLCLSVAMVLFASWMKTITREQQHVRNAQQQVQADYLAAAGIARAKAYLAIDPGYAGETWRLGRESLAASSGATVVIRVAAITDGPRQRQVTVEATFPQDGPHRARRSKQITLELPKSGEAS